MLIYKITNLVNNKIYIGKQENLNESYMGSGLLITRAIKKYGKENFSKEIICKCKTSDELNQKEIYWINKMKSTEKSIGYNITKGGDGGDTLSNHPNKEKIIKQINITRRNRGIGVGPKNHNYGKKLSEETKKKISNKNKELYAKGIIPRQRMTPDGKRRLAEYMKEHIYTKTPAGKIKNKENNLGSKNPNANFYEFISPEGKIIEVKGGIKAFCDKHNLPYKKIIKIYNNNESVNGWKCNKISKINTK